MKNRKLLIAVIMAAFLTLFGATSAQAALQDNLVNDAVEVTVTGVPGQQVTHDVFANDTNVSPSWLVVGSGDCNYNGFSGSVTYTLPGGEIDGDQHTCVISVFDPSVFEQGQESLTFTYDVPPPPDEIAPEVTITSPADGAPFTVNSAQVEFTATDNSGTPPSCKIGVNPVTSPTTVGLSEGANTIEVVCEDGAGNEGSDQVTVTYTEPPPPPPPPSGPVLVYVSDPSVSEDVLIAGKAYATFQVTLSRSTNVPVEVKYSTIPWSANLNDFVMTAGVLTIAAGQTTGEIKVTIKADTRKEAAEVFKLLYFTCDTSVAKVGDPVYPGLNIGTADATIEASDGYVPPPGNP